jgi:transcriptional regulator GlxA family with amidase domain
LSSAAGVLAAGLGAEASARSAPATSPSLDGKQGGGPAAAPIKVAFAISEGTTNIDWVGPEAVFQTWHRDRATGRVYPPFQLFTVSERLDPISGLAPAYTYETAPVAQIVVVPAQRGSPALHDWLRRAHGSADVVMSVCVGARHLALAGLLDGKRATTHHESLEAFRREFPRVNWVGGVRFVEGGERIITGGGLTAGIDVALRVHERYFGRAETHAVAEHLEYSGRGWIV